MGGGDNWKVNDADFSYALSLVSRMASDFYGIDFQTIVVMMKEQLPFFPPTTENENQEEFFIRSFVTYMADKVHEDRAIDKFVLFIDEALAIEDHILIDPNGVVRRALLDKDVTFNGGLLKIALSIFSLSLRPIGESHMPLLVHIKEQMELKYCSGGSPSDELLAAVIFNDGVVLDSEVESLIKDEIFTNSVKSVSKKNTLWPEYIVAMMLLVTSTGSTDLAKAFNGGITAIIDSITEIEGEGYIREVIYYEWMKIRFGC